MQAATGVVTQRDGYKAVGDASWDRFNSAYKNLPEAAQKGMEEQFTELASDWSKDPANAQSFKSASPEQREEWKWMWQAQAARNYGLSQGAQGSPADQAGLLGEFAGFAAATF